MDLEYISITDRKKKQFISKGINTVEELVRFIPRAYEDYTKETDFKADADNCLICDCMKVNYVNGPRPYVSSECYHPKSARIIKVRWFNQNYLYRQIKDFPGRKVLLCGKVVYSKEYNTYSCANPKIFTDNITADQKIHAIYSRISGMSQAYINEKVRVALTAINIYDPLPDDIRKKYGVCHLGEAYKKIHCPQTMEDVEIARKRLIFDELLYFTLALEQAGRSVSKGSQYNIKSLSEYNRILNALPYSLTDDQASVLKDMIKQIKDGRRLSALLQGDVSCGKSIVAFLMAIAMAGSGYQVAIMAPTQVLAHQHYDELSRLLAGSSIKCTFYSGHKMRAKERTEMLSGIKDGTYKIMVGTHSLLSKDVEYKNLALTIIDEEHKFGVLQKQALIERASAGIHSITMSATPIPRSLSQVIYDSSTQIYTIKQMPKGRKKVKSCVSGNRRAIHKFIGRELEAGHQIYVVCPTIETRENKEDLKSVSEVLAEYNKAFPGNNVRALTGKDNKSDVAEIIRCFNEGSVDILIATTVIEVGVNVPNATVIVIENAENFGLASLHQLRGRVGRGEAQGYCILASDQLDNERLKTIASTTDGFQIAEKDLEMRGSGEFIGTRQSGDDRYVSLIMSDLRNRETYMRLKDDAEELYDSGKCEEFIAEQRNIKESA